MLATAEPAALSLHSVCPSQMPVSPGTPMDRHRHLQCSSNSAHHIKALAINSNMTDQKPLMPPHQLESPLPLSTLPTVNSVLSQLWDQCK